VNFVTIDLVKCGVVAADEQREVLDKLNDCRTELEDIAERTLFAYVFKLGMRIVESAWLGEIK
jgi:hypothetical protein